MIKLTTGPKKKRTERDGIAKNAPPASVRVRKAKEWEIFEKPIVKLLRNADNCEENTCLKEAGNCSIGVGCDQSNGQANTKQ